MSWEIYDRLLSHIPDDLFIEDVLQHHWWLVKTKNHVGISMHFEQAHNTHTLADKIKGMKLKTLAQYIKSWNFFEATAAIAAINAFYNTTEK